MNTQTFQSNLQTCQRHADRLGWAMDTLSHHIPLTPEKLATLTPVELAVFDQFVVRYSKLQDAMGVHLLPGILDLTQEQGVFDTFIDKLNRLEKIGAIESSAQWQQLREMRNQFAHDYPDDPNIQASLLNKGYQLASTLLSELARLKAFTKPYLASS